MFRLFGYAGTGKSTLAKHLGSTCDGRVLFAAFTGKAAHVMHKKGCLGARTIHSLIYHPKDKSKKRLRDLEEAYNEAYLETRREWPGEPVPVEKYPCLVELSRQIEEEKANLDRPSFVLNHDSDLKDADLLVVDECSMVGDQMGEDLMSFEVPILVLGDPAQLPPVASTGFFTQHEPDALLTEIHRQAKDDPIIQMATDVRVGNPLPYGRYGESQVLRTREFDRDSVDPDKDQVIVGKNATRRRANLRLRKSLLGERPTPVCCGDKLVALRNDAATGVLNGSLWRVRDWYQEGEDDFIELKMSDDDDPGRVVSAPAWPHYLEGREHELDGWTKRDALEVDYGYALTAHKAQGSQWESVVVVDESKVFRHNAKKWLYTALTRASRRVIVVR